MLLAPSRTKFRKQHRGRDAKQKSHDGVIGSSHATLTHRDRRAAPARALERRPHLNSRPAQDAEGAERDPAARSANAVFHIERYLIGVTKVQGPATVLMPPGLHDFNCLGDAFVGLRSRAAQVPV